MTFPGTESLYPRPLPSLKHSDTNTVEYCSPHALEGMVDVKNIKCRTEGCGKLAYFGVTGTIMKEYCAQHAPEGMADVKNRKCRT